MERQSSEANLVIDSLTRLSEQFGRAAIRRTEAPSEWIQKHYYVPDPRDPKTGELLSPGPIRLTKLQCKIVDSALEKDEKGDFKYATVVYSAPKKSGKSAIASAVILYMAHHNPNSYIACVANDGKQSSDRLYLPIRTCLRYHRQFGGIFKDVMDYKTETTLSNFTKIEAISTDASSEAGSQPLFVALSELWGFTSDRKRAVFTELTVPSTLYGRAIRWIETYAGYSGKSELLENIYETGFLNGEPHPDFLDLLGKDGPVVRVNENARMFTYWDTEPRMSWQLGKNGKSYYASEAAILPPNEFRRIHRNQWVSHVDSFIQEEWWQACENPNLKALPDGDGVPVVVGIDMAVTRDCAALVAVTRDPFNPESAVATRGVKIFSPKEHGGIIDQDMLIKPVIEEWNKRWNVVCWVYDPREMANLAQQMIRAGIGWFRPFGQQQPRAIADKELHDLIVAKNMSWNRYTTHGNIGFEKSKEETLYKHITQAGAITNGNARRIEKLSNNAKVDGAVALSQAAHMCLSLALDNPKGV